MAWEGMGFLFQHWHLHSTPKCLTNSQLTAHIYVTSLIGRPLSWYPQDPIAKSKGSISLLTRADPPHTHTHTLLPCFHSHLPCVSESESLENTSSNSKLEVTNKVALSGPLVTHLSEGIGWICNRPSNCSQELKDIWTQLLLLGSLNIALQS